MVDLHSLWIPRGWARRSLALLMILWFLLVQTGCSPTVAPVEAKTPLRVEWTNWEGDYTMLVAQEKGLFEKYGVQVEPVYYENFSETLPDLAAGKLDGGLLGMVDALNIANRIDARAVAIYDSGGLTSVVAVPEIKSPLDLKGKRIGLTLGSSAEMVIGDLLRRSGLTQDDITLVDMTVEQMPEELSKTIDAAILYEPYTSQAIENGNVALKASEISSLLPDIIVFRNEVVANRPEDIRAFLQAWFEAAQFRLENPEESKRIIAAKTGLPESEIITGDAQVYTLPDNRRLFGLGGFEGFASIYDVAKTNLDYLVSAGSITNMIDLNRLFDPSFLPER